MPNSKRITTSIEPITLNNRFLLMRHGQSLANERGLIVSCPENAIAQYGLTFAGTQQVHEAIKAADLGNDVIIVSSDYARARETAEIAHHLLQADSINFDTRLRERSFGDWELQEDSNYESVWESDLAQPTKPKNNVESVVSVINRTLSCIMDLNADYDSRQILLVCHGDVLQIALAHFAGVLVHRHRSLKPLENAEIRLLASN